MSYHLTLSSRMIWNSGPDTDARRLIVLVVFIGGVTFAEISALRFLESQVCFSIYPLLRYNLRKILY
jgi:hypothetical protein